MQIFFATNYTNYHELEFVVISVIRGKIPIIKERVIVNNAGPAIRKI